LPGLSARGAAIAARSLTDVRVIKVGSPPHAHIGYVSTRDTAWVANSRAGGLSVLDGSTGQRVSHLSLPALPAHFVVDQSAARVYVALPDADEVAVIDSSTLQVEHTIRLAEGAQPSALMPAFQRGRLFVLNYGDNTVVAVDIGTGHLLNSVAVGRAPLWGLPMREMDDLYVASEGSNAIAVLNPEATRSLATIGVGHAPVRYAVYRERGLLYTANATDNSVTIVDIAERRVVASLMTGVAPFRLVTLREKSGEDEVWVLHRGSDADPTGQIRVIDGATNSLKQTIRVVDRPVGWLLRANHAHVVSAALREMSVVDLQRKRAVATLRLPRPPESNAVGSNMVFTRRGFLFIANADDSVTLLRRP
jgi:YVTN family beta-propeller protein